MFCLRRFNWNSFKELDSIWCWCSAAVIHYHWNALYWSFFVATWSMRSVCSAQRCSRIFSWCFVFYSCKPARFCAWTAQVLWFFVTCHQYAKIKPLCSRYIVLCRGQLIFQSMLCWCRLPRHERLIDNIAEQIKNADLFEWECCVMFLSFFSAQVRYSSIAKVKFELLNPSLTDVALDSRSSFFSP